MWACVFDRELQHIKKNEFETIRKFIFLIYSCILYRIHMPRRSATAELPPHLVRITSVYAGRMCSFMKIKLFGWQRPPRARACTLPWPFREQLRNRVRRRGVCNHKDRHILPAFHAVRTVASARWATSAPGPQLAVIYYIVLNYYYYFL